MTGSAPLFQTAVAKRSSRRSLNSRLTAVTTKNKSTLTAMTCAFGERAGGASQQRRAPLEDVLDRCAIRTVNDGDPIADDGTLDFRQRAEQLAGQVTERRTRAREVETALPFRHDARGQPFRAPKPFELRGEEIVEAEGRECRQALRTEADAAAIMRPL